MNIPIPPVLSGEESKNTFYTEPSMARNKKWIRATSLNVLRECPEQFYAKFCEGLPQPKQKGKDYAMIGTLFHEVVESYIIYKWELDSEFARTIQKLLLAHDIRESEIVSLGNYLNRIRQYREGTIEVEHEFEYVLVPGLPKIRGHIDWITKLGHKHALITDHKTNRQPKQLEKWIDDLQTICYAWATRKFLGSDWKIDFKIGYINLPYDAEWECKPEFDESLKNWYERNWEKLLEQERKNAFQRTAGDTCKYCPRSGNCSSERKGKAIDSKLLDITLKRLHQ